MPGCCSAVNLCCLFAIYQQATEHDSGCLFRLSLFTGHLHKSTPEPASFTVIALPSKKYSPPESLKVLYVEKLSFPLSGSVAKNGNKGNPALRFLFIKVVREVGCALSLQVV